MKKSPGTLLAVCQKLSYFADQDEIGETPNLLHLKALPQPKELSWSLDRRGGDPIHLVTALLEERFYYIKMAFALNIRCLKWCDNARSLGQVA